MLRAALAATALLLSGVMQAQPSLRNLSVDDLLAREELADDAWTVRYALSPDGKMLAYVVERSMLANKSGNSATIRDSDVWIVKDQADKAINLTHGSDDSASFIHPVWSPDGQRLAIMGTRGPGQEYKLWIWSRATGKLQQIGERTVAFVSNPKKIMPRLAWISSSELFFLTLPEGRQHSADYSIVDGGATVRDDRDAAEKVKAGKEITGIVLDAGLTDTRREAAASYERAYPIAYCNVDTREVHLVSEQLLTAPMLSPDRRRVMSLKLEGDTGRLVLLDKNGAVRLPWHSALSKVFWNFDNDYLPWSPDGSQFSFVAQNGPELVTALFILNIDKQTVRAAPLADLVVPVLKTRSSMPARKGYIYQWLDEDHLLLKASRGYEVTLFQGKADGPAKSRLDWWMIDLAGRAKPINLTGSFRDPPSELAVLRSDRSAVYGISEESVWRITVRTAARAQCCEEVGGITDFASGGDPETRTDWMAVHRVGENDPGRLVFLNPLTKRGVSQSNSNAAAAFHMSWPERQQAISVANDPTGTYLWWHQDSSAPRLVHQTNTHFREVAQPSSMPFEYVNSDGRRLDGWILLPAGYESSKHLPMIVRVYAGAMVSRGHSPFEMNARNLSQLQYPELWAGRGYAVMVPSMPLPPIGKPADPLLEHAKNVMPAVDKVVEMGIADPDRLAVMGNSYGGYTVYGLITQVHRFKAAVASAGKVSLDNSWGMFVGADRYSEMAHLSNFHPSLMETGQSRMMSPPWEDQGRYLRNSPFTYVDRVQTPVLMVHGDIDHLPVQDIEKFFTALQRQGKRARFIRYFAEHCHGSCESPANNRHMMAHAYAWVDEFLDIARDPQGQMLFYKDKARSRGAAKPLAPEDFLRFDARTSW